MGRKSTIALVSLALVVLGLGVGAFVYDQSQKDVIADGVTVNGVDVGGLTAEEAEQKLRARILDPLKKPVTVTFKKQTFELPAEKLKIRADLDRSVATAVEKSNEGGLPTRVFRGVTGGTLDENVPLELGYSKPAINQFVRHVAEKLQKDPVDATVSPTATSLEVVEAENGHKLRDVLLTDQLTRMVEKGKGPRVVAAKTTVLKPEVTTKEVASAYPTYLTLDRANYTLRLWKDLKLEKEYTVAVGQVGLETPAGVYNIQSKQVDPTWYVPDSAWAGDMAGQVVPPGPSNPLKARWMGIYDGAGIHGTDDVASLGSAASHGCVRMSVTDVIDLYDRVEVGTPIYIG